MGLIDEAPGQGRDEVALSALSFEDRMAPYSSDILIDGRRIRYACRGDGPAVLLCHGIPLAMATWQDLFFELSAHYRVFALDMPGYGASDKSLGDYSLDAISLQIARFCGRLGIDQVFVAGSSFGAAVAATLSIRFPELVRGAVLINSVGIDGGTHAVERAARIGLLRYAMRNALLRKGFGRQIFRSKLRASYARLVPDEKLVDHYYHLLLKDRGEESFLQTLRQFSERDLQQQLPELEKPVLLIWGTEDRVLPVARSVAVQKRIRNCWSVLVPGAGHLPHEERPRRCADLMRQFFAMTTRASGPVPSPKGSPSPVPPCPVPP